MGYEIQSILDSCKRLQYLSLIRTEWKDNGNDTNINDSNIVIPSTLVGLCFIDSCFNMDLSRCRNTLWEISMNIVSLISNNKQETKFLQHIGKYGKSLKQIVLLSDVTTQSLKIITSKF